MSLCGFSNWAQYAYPPYNNGDGDSKLQYVLLQIIYSKGIEYWRKLNHEDRRLYDEITRLVDTFGFFQNDPEATDSLNYARIQDFILSCDTVANHWKDCKGIIVKVIFSIQSP